MQIIVDFALTESREQLDKVLLNLKQEVEFELHNALAEHENRLSDEQGGVDVTISDTDRMVDGLVESMFGRLRNILNYPHHFVVNEGTNEFEDLLSAAFESAGESLAQLHHENLTETYVAVIMSGQPSNITDTVTWSDIVSEASIQKVRQLYQKAEMEVLAICRRELIYLGEKYGGQAV